MTPAKTTAGIYNAFSFLSYLGTQGRIQDFMIQTTTMFPCCYVRKKIAPFVSVFNSRGCVVAVFSKYSGSQPTYLQPVRGRQHAKPIPFILTDQTVSNYVERGGLSTR